MSASDLKQRGWTNELIRKLLPTPANIRIKGCGRMCLQRKSSRNLTKAGP